MVIILLTPDDKLGTISLNFKREGCIFTALIIKTKKL